MLWYSLKCVNRLWCVKCVTLPSVVCAVLASHPFKHTMRLPAVKHRGRGNSPCPLSRNSVMMAALQGDQGLVRLIWMRVGDIMWLSCSFPNTSSQAFTLSCGMLNTCPAEREREVRWEKQRYSNLKHKRKCFCLCIKWWVALAYRAHEPWWRLKVGRRLRSQSSSSLGRTWCRHPPYQECHRWRRHTDPGLN